MIHYLIVDDEPIAHRIIEKYCDNLPHFAKQKSCYNAFEAMQLLNESPVDLMFLDINMPKLSGFEFLKTLSHPPKIIVTTAYKEFAIEGYELNVSDYLLKPFSFARFMKAVNKTMADFKDKNSIPIAAQSEAIANETSSFFLKVDKKHHQVHFEELLFIEAFGHYTKVFLKHEMVVSHEKISSFEVLLPESHFIRTHKSFIVAKNKINHIEGNQIIIEEHKIPIGQTYKANVNKFL